MGPMLSDNAELALDFQVALSVSLEIRGKHFHKISLSLSLPLSLLFLSFNKQTKAQTFFLL